MAGNDVIRNYYALIFFSRVIHTYRIYGCMRNMQAVLVSFQEVPCLQLTANLCSTFEHFYLLKLIFNFLHFLLDLNVISP